MTLAELNRLGEERAADALRPCCGSHHWAKEMAARRPFAHITELHTAADLTWEALNPEDRLEAFGSHPKIGEIQGVSDWSRKEQEGVAAASNPVRARLAELNHKYRERFGFIFIIFATGKSAEEMLTSLEKRLENTPENELRIAGREQMKIVHLRLNKLIER